MPARVETQNGILTVDALDAIARPRKYTRRKVAGRYERLSGLPNNPQ